MLRKITRDMTNSKDDNTPRYTPTIYPNNVAPKNMSTPKEVFHTLTQQATQTILQQILDELPEDLALHPAESIKWAQLCLFRGFFTHAIYCIYLTRDVVKRGLPPPTGTNDITLGDIKATVYVSSDTTLNTKGEPELFMLKEYFVSPKQTNDYTTGWPLSDWKSLNQNPAYSDQFTDITKHHIQLNANNTMSTQKPPEVIFS